MPSRSDRPRILLVALLAALTVATLAATIGYRLDPAGAAVALVPVAALYVIGTRIERSSRWILLGGLFGLLAWTGLFVAGSIADGRAPEAMEFIPPVVFLSVATGWLVATTELLYRRNWIPAIVSIVAMVMWIGTLMPKSH